MELTAREQAGRKIYLEGESPTGREISAEIGAGARLPGSAVPCANCHGEEGLGRPEGGLLPPEVTWSQLTKPYGHLHPNGRRHASFSDKSVARAVAEGLDPDGNRLDPGMPRYSMPAEDMASLIAYLRRLEEQGDPGLTESEIRLGVVLPTRGRLGEVGQAMAGLLRAYCDALNAEGGIHGRRLELVLAEYDSDLGTGLSSARELLARGSVFALLSGLVPGEERGLAALAEKERLPLIGPLTPWTWEGEPPGRHVFFTVSGVGEQAQVLAEYAVRELHPHGPRVAIIHPEQEGLAEAARAARERFRAHGWERVEVLRYARGGFDPGVAARLKRSGTRLVLFLGNEEELEGLMGKARALGWAPYLLLSGSLSARAAARAPASLDGHLFLAYSSLPSDERPGAVASFNRLRAGVQASERHRLPQVSAYTAAAVLTEALRRTGRQLSRARLLSHLERLYAFEPGLVPPVSYGPDRHVGARGAYVVTVDLTTRTFRPLGGWVALRP
jgi:ABC-type branched-subunit amino acid transport system substrate-binding protein